MGQMFSWLHKTTSCITILHLLGRKKQGKYCLPGGKYHLPRQLLAVL